MRTLHLIRHGETVENARRILMGSHDGTLSDKGREQMRALDGLFALERFDIVFVSPLQRCRDSWSELAPHLDQAYEPIFIEELKERAFGEWENKPYPTPADWEELAGDFVNRKPPGGESIVEFNQRAKQALDAIAAHDFKDALVLGHNGQLRAMMNMVTNTPQALEMYNFSLPNAGYIKLFID